jgi:hypothetical protein
MYYLVVLADVPGRTTDGIDHESFVDSLVARHAVLLGGALGLASGMP